jgi:hypothetical protein
MVMSMRTVGTGASALGSGTAAKPGRKRVIGSSSASAPSSRSANRAAAVKLLVHEAMR